MIGDIITELDQMRHFFCKTTTRIGPTITTTIERSKANIPSQYPCIRNRFKSTKIRFLLRGDFLSIHLQTVSTLFKTIIYQNLFYNFFFGKRLPKVFEISMKHSPSFVVPPETGAF